MRAIRWTSIGVLVATAGVLIGAAPPAQDATQTGRRSQPQPAGNPPAETATQVSVIALQHALAEEVAAIVSKVIEGRIMADPRTNSLIVAVAADGDALSRVQDLVAKLDVPENDPRRTPPETRYFEMNSPIRDSELMMIRQIATSSRVAADGRLLAAQGPKDDLAIIEQLVTKLNAAYAASPGMSEELHPRAIQANFFLIETRLDGSKPENATPLPAALQPVAGTLAQNGFANASLLAPLLVNLVESSGGNEFHLEGSAGAEGGIDVDLSGKVRSVPGSKRVDLSVRAQLTERVRFPAGRSVKGVESFNTVTQKIFTIQTRLEAILGDYVILAATPSSTVDGRAIALVVRVTATE